MFENELTNKSCVVESHLKRFLRPDLLDSIDANECQLDVTIDFKEVKEFVDINSLMPFEDDYDSCEIIRLVFQGEVVACQVFNDVRTDMMHEYDFLLVGTCIKNGFDVKGAMKKMLCSFVERHSGTVIRTYVDNRWPILKSEHEKVGFKVSNTTGIMGKFYKRSNPRMKPLLRSQMKDFLINHDKYDFA